MTSIEFDLDLHLYENHWTELVKLPIGKGNRVAYAIREGRKISEAIVNLTPEGGGKKVVC
jgi:hypothetical protein